MQEMDAIDGMDEIKASMFGMLEAELPKPLFQEIEETECRIELTDGVRLFTKVYKPIENANRLPKEKGKWPVVLIRNPYMGNDMAVNGITGPAFAKAGYAVVYTQVRGTLQSEGGWLPFENEREDGRDVIDWIAGQDWCDGNIGCFGASYLGHTQWCIADYHHPMLKTMFISVYGIHPYHTFYRRGMFRQDIWTAWAAQMMEDNKYKIFFQKDDFDLREKAYSISPQIELGMRLKEKDCSWYQNWVTNIAEDSSYWNTGFWKELENSVSDIQIPLFLHGGWFDIFLRSQLDTYRNLPADIRSKSRFLIGPWQHAGMTGGSLSYPDENRAGFMQLKAALEWFDFHLKGKEYPHQTGIMEAYSIGDNQWKYWRDDLPVSKNKTFFFCGTQEGRLCEICPESEEKRSFTYNPKNPVKSAGGTLLSNNTDPMGEPECSTIQPKVGEREDVLSYLSDEMTDNVYIAGAMEVHLFVSSTAPATSFTVKVMEVFADGRSVNIRDDITDIRWVDEERVISYEEGDIRELSLKLLDICWMVAAGSKLRVDISSTNYPAYHVHPNTTEIWSETTNYTSAVQTIYSGRQYPARIEF